MGGFRFLTSDYIHIEPNILTWSSFYTDLWAKALPGWSPSMPISCKFSYGSKSAITRKNLSTSRVSQIRRVFVERVSQYGERPRQSLGYISAILSRLSCTTAVVAVGPQDPWALTRVLAMVLEMVRSGGGGNQWPRKAQLASAVRAGAPASRVDTRRQHPAMGPSCAKL